MFRRKIPWFHSPYYREESSVSSSTSMPSPEKKTGVSGTTSLQHSRNNRRRSRRILVCFPDGAESPATAQAGFLLVIAITVASKVSVLTTTGNQTCASQGTGIRNSTSRSLSEAGHLTVAHKPTYYVMSQTANAQRNTAHLSLAFDAASSARLPSMTIVAASRNISMVSRPGGN